MTTENPTAHPPRASQAQLDALQDALSRTVDAHAGFETMTDKAEPDFRSVPLRFRELHHQHADRLASAMAALGGEPDREGGLMSTVNKAVVSVRALFDEIDDDVLDNIRDGEEHVLEALAEAEEALPAGRYRDDVAAMQAELRALLDETAPLG
ncbi:DUF2383 domain-containing protein [Thalassococcus sp. BH17M4-6]|uniref:DUF2383 domain-containing protein n=1 Tax=Thalassococcus sp. BH17M4-6 TaxID=3413148 RepID=UPI003BC771DD